MSEIEIGKFYKNIHTHHVCKVIGKIFYNIKYNELNDKYNFNPRYCHYKKFIKNWVVYKEAI